MRPFGRVFCSLSVVALAMVWGAPLEAREVGSRGWGLFHGRQPAFNRQAAIAAYGKSVYPRYNFGFHTRELQNVGVPHGDVGILGSGLTRDPW
jgi:hypothetical protein